MPIINQEAWDSCVKRNKDAYGKCCVDVAREVMAILDKDEPFDVYKIVCSADDNIKTGGITGFMAGCVANMVSLCHSRGEEFRRQWNIKYQINNEGEEANKGKDVLNPALLSLEKRRGKNNNG